MMNTKLKIGIIALVIGIILVGIWSFLDKDSLKRCESHEDCIWLADGRCECCWNKKATYAVIGSGKCSRSIFCVCEKNICKYPSKEWIRQNKELAIKKCKDAWSLYECYSELALILNDSTLCDKIPYDEDRNFCHSRLK